MDLITQPCTQTGNSQMLEWELKLNALSQYDMNGLSSTNFNLAQLIKTKILILDIYLELMDFGTGIAITIAATTSSLLL